MVQQEQSNMTEQEFIGQLKISKERGGLTKEVISHVREMTHSEYKTLFPFEKRGVPEEAVKKVFVFIDQIWPEFNLEKILSPVSYFQTIIKSALNEFKRNS